MEWYNMERWINNIKYSQHKQIHDFLFCSLFRSSKLLILMNQWVKFSNIIFVLWCRSVNNALVKLKTTTPAKSNLKYRYSEVWFTISSTGIKTNGPLSDPNGLMVLKFFFSFFTILSALIPWLFHGFVGSCNRRIGTSFLLIYGGAFLLGT